MENFCKKYKISKSQFLGIELIYGNLDLDNITSIPEGFNPTVGGSLHLDNVTSIPEGFNPTVGGNLYLHSVTSIPEGFNPTVGGNLYLHSVTSIPEGFNPTVGGGLYLDNGLKAEKKTYVNPKFFSWNNGKFIMVDDILCEVINRRGKAYKIKIVGKIKESYLIIDGRYSAHGETLKKAKDDLFFKVNAEKIKNNPIKKDTIITIEHYRIVTGACEQGVKHWMEQNGVAENIKAIDLLPILRKTNAYGLSKFEKLCI